MGVGGSLLHAWRPNAVDARCARRSAGHRDNDVSGFSWTDEAGRNRPALEVEVAVDFDGGGLGVGDSYHPLPWNVLTYDTNRGGYVVDLDNGVRQDAPS